MTASISQLNMKFHRVPGILSMGVQCISPLWCISACSPAAQHSTSWLDWIPYIGAVAAIVLGRFLLKLISQKPPPYPMFNYWEQNELYGKSQLNKERLAQLEFFRRKDPTFEGDEFLKWVNSEIAEAIHNVYKVDPDIQHEILNEWVAMPPEEKEKVQKYNGLWGMPVERLRPFCTDEMIRQLEKEMGSECGRITGKVITGSGAVSGPSVRHSSYVGSKPVCLGKTYLWNQRNERFEITKIWQEEGMDHIRVREHREAEERKYDSSQKYVAHMEILRFILEECDYSFSRPSDSKEWLLSAKGEKKVIERRPGMLVQGYKMLG